MTAFHFLCHLLPIFSLFTIRKRKNKGETPKTGHLEKEGQPVEKQGQPVEIFLSKNNDLRGKKSRTTHFSRNARHLQDENTPGRPPSLFDRPKAMNGAARYFIEGVRGTNDKLHESPDMKKARRSGLVAGHRLAPTERSVAA